MIPIYRRMTSVPIFEFWLVCKYGIIKGTHLHACQAIFPRFFTLRLIGQEEREDESLRYPWILCRFSSTKDKNQTLQHISMLCWFNLLHLQVECVSRCYCNVEVDNGGTRTWCRLRDPYCLLHSIWYLSHTLRHRIRPTTRYDSWMHGGCVRLFFFIYRIWLGEQRLMYNMRSSENSYKISREFPSWRAICYHPCNPAQPLFDFDGQERIEIN